MVFNTYRIVAVGALRSHIHVPSTFILFQSQIVIVAIPYFQSAVTFDKAFTEKLVI